MRFLGGHTVTELVLVHEACLVLKLILINNGLLLVDLELDLALLVELFEEVNAVPLEALNRERVNWRSKALLSILLVRLAQKLAHLLLCQGPVDWLLLHWECSLRYLVFELPLVQVLLVSLDLKLLLRHRLERQSSIVVLGDEWVTQSLKGGQAIPWVDL